MERVSDVVNRVLEDSFWLLIPMDIRCILATYFLSSSTMYRCVLRHQSWTRSFQPQYSHRGQRHDGGSSNLDISHFPILFDGRIEWLAWPRPEAGKGWSGGSPGARKPTANWSHSWWTDPHELMKRCNHQWCLIKQRFRRRQGEDF